MVLAIAYVWLASQTSIWCWPAGFVSTALYTYVYWEVNLVFQTLLNAYYMAMAVWGFIHWRSNKEETLHILKMSLKQHLGFWGLGFVVSIVVFLIASRVLNYDLLMLDIALTVFSLLTTYLTVKKYMDSWCYWSVINFLSFYLVWQSKLYPTALLMIVYLVIALRGFMHWRAIYQKQTVKTS